MQEERLRILVFKQQHGPVCLVPLPLILSCKHEHKANEAASCVIAGITGGPGICHTALFSSGRLANSFPGYQLEIKRISKLCRSLAAVTSLSVIHTVVLLCWIGLDVYLVYSASSSSNGQGMTKGEGFKLPMWRLVRGEYKQVGQVDMGDSAFRPVMATPMKQSSGGGGYSYGGGYSQTRSPVNPFGSAYEVDDSGPFDNPFERTPTKQSVRR